MLAGCLEDVWMLVLLNCNGFWNLSKTYSRFVMIFPRLLMYILGFLSLVWIPSVERVNFGLIFDVFFYWLSLGLQFWKEESNE